MKDYRSGWGGKAKADARKYWRRLLPLPCSRCGKPVLPEHRWHVDHLVDLVAGGSLTDRKNQWPAHGPCNERAGQATAQRRMSAAKNRDKGIREW